MFQLPIIWTSLKTFLSNPLIQKLLIVIVFILVLVLYTNKVKNDLEDKLLLEIENKVLQQREEFRNEADEISREIKNLDTEQLRDRARQWMR